MLSHIELIQISLFFLGSCHRINPCSTVGKEELVVFFVLLVFVRTNYRRYGGINTLLSRESDVHRSIITFLVVCPRSPMFKTSPLLDHLAAFPRIRPEKKGLNNGLKFEIQVIFSRPFYNYFILPILSNFSKLT